MRAEEGFQFPALASANRWEADVAFKAAVVRHLCLDKNLTIAEVERLSNNLLSFSARIRDGELKNIVLFALH